MEISGSLRANCAPEVLVATLTDVRALERVSFVMKGGAEQRR